MQEVNEPVGDRVNQLMILLQLMFSRQKQPEKEQAPRRKISKRQWFEVLKEKRIPSHKLKEQVLKFLAVCGNYDLVETFAKEAGIAIPSEIADNQESIQNRFEIRELVIQGKIDDAIEKVQAAKQGFQTDHMSILFNLKLLKVIQLIRANQIADSILLAQKELVPLAKGHQDYITEVEQVMTLVAFKDIKNCPNHYLCEEGHAIGVAFELNQAITRPTQVEYLTSIAKLQQWCQDRLTAHLDFPILDISHPYLFE